MRVDGWENEGTLGDSADINTLTGTAESTSTDGSDLPAVCFDINDAITFIEYNTNSAVRPELTMEIWIKPTAAATGNDWLLGHDNGGYDRSIIVYDGRYGGIAMGVGGTYTSTVTYPVQNEWTQVIATFSKSAGVATVYKNGGVLNAPDGQTQATNIQGDSGGEPKYWIKWIKELWKS